MLKQKNLTRLDINMELALLTTCRKLLSSFPSGCLKFNTTNGKRQYYFKRPTDLNYTAVKKKDPKLVQLAAGICRRKWLETMIKTLEHNILWERKMLRHYRAYDFRGIQSLVPDAYKFLRKKDWNSMLTNDGSSKTVIQSENPYHREALIIRTSFGLLVRSKSEAIIAEMLYAAGIPFRYEPEINLMQPDGTIRKYYPDFVLQHPLGGNLYWEHAGKVNDAEYRKRNEAKFIAYFHNHITLGSNLIVTCDNVDGAPDIQMFCEIIRKRQTTAH